VSYQQEIVVATT